MSSTHPRVPVVILDFGSQYTQLIARRVRELEVYCEIHPFSTPLATIAAMSPRAIILSGGPASVDEADAPAPPHGLIDLGVPVLGICYGCQWLVHQAGGRVEASQQREFGHADLGIVPGDHRSDGLFRRLPADRDATRVWMSHSDHVARLPPDFIATARTSDGIIAGVQHAEKPLYGVQFHPEVHHSEHGRDLLAAFVLDIAGVVADWTSNQFIEDTLAAIRARVGPDEHVICGLSGGVDSAVAATLVHRAIGDRLHCVFVDSGLLRKDEATEVVRVFRDELGLPLKAVDAAATFLGELRGITDPERKRKTIGRVFIDVFDEAARDVPNARWLCQGTLYPDVIESVSVRGPSATIKTHHNVGGLPERMKLSLLEPLRELFKDEVRVIGKALGMPAEVLARQPFPGPGLAIRVLGEVTPERVAILQRADAIVREEMVRLGPAGADIWQGFAVLLPVRTVGVMGDSRTYEEVCAIRSVGSTDGMTATVHHWPWEALTRTATRIVNEVRGINRVVYDITSKPPGTIEWE
jgi:GMP synthase (glutamine-hydrolysing)